MIVEAPVKLSVRGLPGEQRAAMPLRARRRDRIASRQTGFDLGEPVGQDPPAFVARGTPKFVGARHREGRSGRLEVALGLRSCHLGRDRATAGVLERGLGHAVAGRATDPPDAAADTITRLNCLTELSLPARVASIIRRLSSEPPDTQNQIA